MPTSQYHCLLYDITNNSSCCMHGGRETTSKAHSPGEKTSNRRAHEFLVEVTDKGRSSNPKLQRRGEDVCVRLQGEGEQEIESIGGKVGRVLMICSAALFSGSAAARASQEAKGRIPLTVHLDRVDCTLYQEPLTM